MKARTVDDIPFAAPCASSATQGPDDAARPRPMAENLADVHYLG